MNHRRAPIQSGEPPRPEERRTRGNKRRGVGNNLAGHKVTTETPTRFWRLNIGPVQTMLIADKAPLCQIVVQNHGPGMVQVRDDDFRR